MTDLDRLHQVFDQELASDMATERAISRRCIYAMLIVIGLLVARTVCSSDPSASRFPPIDSVCGTVAAMLPA